MPAQKHTLEIHRQDIEDIEYLCAFLRFIEQMIPPRTQEIVSRFERAKMSAERLRRLITSA